MTKKLIAIWAEDKNGLIGVDGGLPWRLPKELQHFKETTMGHALLMGRVTFDGMNRRVLPGRETLILSKSLDQSDANVTLVHSVEEALDWYHKQDKNLYIVGGSSIYKAFENHYDELIRTKVQGEFEGDTYFPNLDLSDFERISQTDFTKDDKNAYDFTIEVLKKKN